MGARPSEPGRDWGRIVSTPLTEIAGRMWREAEASGRAQLQLPRGLVVICKVEGLTRKLALYREGTRVPFDERVIAANAFGVPHKLWPEEIPMGQKIWTCYTWSTAPAVPQLQLWEE